jgi:hypothetical protein
MPTYKEYTEYAKAKGFQPLNEKTYQAMIKANYNPITNTTN